MAEKEMSQEEARTRLRNGATLLFLDVPKGTEFGIDYNSWTVGPRFCGVKMITQGLHFIYYSAMGSDKQMAPRCGFFHTFKPQEVLIKKWDQKEEGISMVPSTEEDEQNFWQNLQNYDSGLAPYPDENHKKWISLTDHIKPNVVRLLNPTCRRIYSAAQFESESSTSESRKEAAEERDRNRAEGKKVVEPTDEQGLPNLKEMEDTMIQFTEISDRTFPANATPQEKTAYSMDHSWLLGQVLRRYINVTPSNQVARCSDIAKDNDSSAELTTSSFLGELQFSFIAFLVGYVHEGLEQWKKIVRLLCNSEQAVSACCLESLIEAHPEGSCSPNDSDVFEKFMTVLYWQLEEISQDHFVDITNPHDNFLLTHLRTFFISCESSGKDKLCSRARKFRAHLEKKYGWEFPMEDDDDEGPVVVELQ